MHSVIKGGSHYATFGRTADGCIRPSYSLSDKTSCVNTGDYRCPSPMLKK